MISSIGSITPTITGSTVRPFVSSLANKSASLSTNAIAEAIAQTASKASKTLFNSGAQIAATTASAPVKKSFLSSILRVLSGDFTEDITNAFKNRKNIPFKEGFKRNFFTGQACEAVTKQTTGSLGKIGTFLTKICPFLKNSKVATIGKFAKNNLSVIVAYIIAAYPVYKAFKNYGTAEGIKETLKFGISTASIIASEVAVAILSAYLGPVAGFLKLAAPAAGASFGVWLGNKILGKSIEQKEEEAAAAKHAQQLEELLQNPQIAQQIQQNPKMLQQLQQDAKLTDQIYQNMKQQKQLAQNQQNTNNNGKNLQTQSDEMREQLIKNGLIPPVDQKQRDTFASQFGNPYQSTSLGTFSNLVHNVDVPFAQMVARQDSRYNPLQSFMLCQQLNNDLAAHGYIFG